MINYKIYKNFEEDEIQDIIFFLNNNNKNLFFQSNYFINNCKKIYYDDDSQIYLILLYEKEEPILVVPIVINEKFKIKILKWLSCEAIDFNIPICNFEILHKKSNEINLTFLNAINTLSYDLILFDKLPEFVLKNKNFFLSDLYKNYSMSFYFDFKESIEDFYLKKTNSKTKQTDKRKLKKIAGQNQIKFEKVVLDKNNFELFEELVKKKYYQYYKKQIRSFDPNKIKRFYNNIAIKSNKNFNLVLHKMKIEENVLSVIFGIEQYDYFYFLIPYISNSSVTKYSPGRFHIQELIRVYQKKNMHFDFTAGEEEYKKNWSNSFYTVNYILKLNNLRGLPLYLYFWFYYRFRKNKLIKKIFRYFNIV